MHNIPEREMGADPKLHRFPASCLQLCENFDCVQC